MFSMAYYVGALKRHSKDPIISDEEFVRLLFTPYVIAGNIKDRFGNTLDLNKSRVSNLLSQKDDIPSAMRNALAITGIYEKTRPYFIDFINDYLDENQLQELAQDIAGQICNTPTIASETKRILANNEKVAPEYLCVAFFEAIKQDNKTEFNDYLWHCGQNSLRIECNDLFKYGFQNRKKQQNIVVIPVNTSFETYISWKAEGAEDPIVAPTTLHGQWINRWVKAGNSIQSLNAQIDENLSKQHLPFTINSKGRKNFDIGSIAVVSSEEAVYYLLAISTFDEQNIAHSTEAEIRTAVHSLMRFYNHYGMGFPMYLPLLGTGRSRAALDYQTSFDLIQSEVLRDTQLIQGKITIVVLKEAMSVIHTEVE